jgi:phosphoserine phosphatase
MNAIKAVILDLDQTLTTDVGSWSQFTKLIGADLNTHLSIYNDFRNTKITYPEAKHNLMSLWRTVNNLKREDIVDIFDQIQLRSGAVEAVMYLKDKYKLCIISGAIDIFVNGVADKLGIEYRYASTKFIFDEHNSLQDFDYKLSRGEDKLNFLDDFCKKTNISPTECAALGDGESDMPLFEKVSMPILYIASETTEENKLKIEKQIRNWSEIAKYL